MWTNTFGNLDKYIWQFEEEKTHFAVQTIIFKVKIKIWKRIQIILTSVLGAFNLADWPKSPCSLKLTGCSFSLLWNQLEITAWSFSHFCGTLAQQIQKLKQAIKM